MLLLCPHEESPHVLLVAVFLLDPERLLKHKLHLLISLPLQLKIAREHLQGT